MERWHQHVRLQPGERRLLLALTAIACALRLYDLGSGLWYDEITTLLDSVRVPFWTIVTHFPSNNEHPFYSVLAHAADALVGEHAWSLRLPAALFGIATVPLLYGFGAKIASRLEALAAALLLTVSYHHVWFSQNARGYTMLLFFTLAATWLLLEAIDSGRIGLYLGYGAMSALAAYTHLTMVLVVVGQAAVVAPSLWSRRGRTVWRDFINPAIGFGFAAVLTVALYAPMLGEVRAFFAGGSTWAGAATPAWAAAEALRGLRIGYSLTGAVIIGGVVFLAGGWSYLRQSATLVALFFVPAGVLLVAAVAMGRPIFPRFFFFLAGFGLLVVVRGLVVVARALASRLPARFNRPGAQIWMTRGAIAGAVVVSIAALPAAYRYPKQDYAGALRYVQAAAGPGDRVVLVGSGTSLPYQRYYGQPWSRVSDAAELADVAARTPGVWLIYTLRPFLESQEPDLMAAVRARCVSVATFPGTVAGGQITVARCGAATPMAGR